MLMLHIPPQKLNHNSRNI